jgi:hypothetical protein
MAPSHSVFLPPTSRGSKWPWNKSSQTSCRSQAQFFYPPRGHDGWVYSGGYFQKTRPSWGEKYLGTWHSAAGPPSLLQTCKRQPLPSPCVPARVAGRRQAAGSPTQSGSGSSWFSSPPACLRSRTAARERCLREGFHVPRASPPPPPVGSIWPIASVRYAPAAWAGGAVVWHGTVLGCRSPVAWRAVRFVA